MSPILITKSTGEQEAFDPRKLVRSLVRSGAGEVQAKEIADHIQGELVAGMTTNEIYRHAFDLLRGTASHVAARYSMKRAIADLGPDGFPFERLIAEIYKAKGYEAVTGQVVRGSCVEHEMDVVAWKGDELVMIEAKFHNEPGLKSDLKVALYVKARFDDLKGGVFGFGGAKRKLTSCHLVTNTKFTDHAMRYADCQGLSLIGWNHPQEGNLEDLIEEARLHPLTSLTALTHTEKRTLLDGGLVLCKQLMERKSELHSLGIAKDRIPLILDEAERLCR